MGSYGQYTRGLMVVGLGVAQQYNEMHLLPEPLFSVPTDAIHVMSIEATLHGRIFLAGKDGNLYELAYQVHLLHEHCTMMACWLRLNSIR